MAQLAVIFSSGCLWLMSNFLSYLQNSIVSYTVGMYIKTSHWDNSCQCHNNVYFDRKY